MTLKTLIKQLTPPVVLSAVRSLRTRDEKPEWEYMPNGWQAADTDPAIKGWQDQSIVESYAKRWASNQAYLDPSVPFGYSIETDTDNLPIAAQISFHNIIMSFAYALNLAAVGKSSLRLLDWGGGLGHYALIARALRPDLAIEYHLKELPIFEAKSQSLLPDSHFHSGDTWKHYAYDLILASGAMHYQRDWQTAFAECATATSAGGYFFLTRLPLVRRVPSFVMVQRPYRYGYNTEYLGWCLNHDEVIAQATLYGLTRTREFVIEEPPFIHNAPEQCLYWGFLFRKVVS
ncbi:MAG: hypothetical protein U0670_15540 [Anaerolineae bacterium]